MLVVTRKVGESVDIEVGGEIVRIFLVKIRGYHTARIGIEADKERVRIIRNTGPLITPKVAT